MIVTLGFLLISTLAYVCAKYIAAKWSGIWKSIIGQFFAFLVSWLCGGMLALLLINALQNVMQLGEISHDAIPTFFARAFGWAFLGMLFGIYRGRTSRKRAATESGN